MKKVANASLLATTITRRIDADNIEVQLLERINELPWYIIKVDDTDNVNNKAILLYFMQYIFQEDLYEEILCALLQPTLQLQNY